MGQNQQKRRNNQKRNQRQLHMDPLQYNDQARQEIILDRAFLLPVCSGTQAATQRNGLVIPGGDMILYCIAVSYHISKARELLTNPQQDGCHQTFKQHDPPKTEFSPVNLEVPAQGTTLNYQLK